MLPRRVPLLQERTRPMSPETDRQQNMMIQSNVESVARLDIIKRIVGIVMESLVSLGARRVVVEAIVVAVEAEIVADFKDVRIVRMNPNLMKHHRQQNHQRNRRTTQMGNRKCQCLKA